MSAPDRPEDLRVRFDEVIEQYRSALHDALEGLTEAEARLRWSRRGRRRSACSST